MHNDLKCYNYRTFKKCLIIENYVLELPVSPRMSLTHFRLGKHKLPIEIGRQEGIERHERKRSACDEHGDDFHYLFRCSKFRVNGKIFLIKSYQTCYVSAEQYHALFTSSNYNKLCKLPPFVKYIMEEFDQNLLMPQDYYWVVSGQYYDLHVNYNLAVCSRLFSRVLFAILLVDIVFSHIRCRVSSKP